MSFDAGKSRAGLTRKNEVGLRKMRTCSAGMMGKSDVRASGRRSVRKTCTPWTRNQEKEAYLPVEGRE